MVVKVLPQQFDPPEPTGCAPHDAVCSMLHHLESTYEWETEWDDRSEDFYWDGEMVSYRRIFLPGGAGQATFVFKEDKMHSNCYIIAENTSYTAVTKEEYDRAIAALEEGTGCFTAFVQNKKEKEEKHANRDA